MLNNSEQGSTVTSMSATPPVPPSRASTTIASVALPPRVRRILDIFFAQASADLGNRINLMLVDFEHQLFKQAERARNNAQQAEHFANLHALRANRSDLLPLFMAGLETEVAGIRQPRVDLPRADLKQVEPRTMSLVEHDDINQDVALNDIARHHEQRSQTALYLLGQRFGVLAGSPAFDTAQLPVGPQSLCRILRATVASLRIDLPSQLLLYKSFDQKAMTGYSEWIEGLNTLLSREGVLPGLVFSPRRARNDPGSLASRRAVSGPASLPDAGRPATGWHSEPDQSAWSTFGLNAAPATPQQEHRHAAPLAGASQGGGDTISFAALQQLLSGRHAALAPPGQGLARLGTTALGRPLATHDVISTLRLLQAMPVSMSPGQPRRTMLNVQEALLAQVREQYGAEATLVQEDADTFELLDLLYNQIEHEVQRDTQAVDMLVRLQVPVAQAALNDREFFLRPQHPARELLNSVAESGAVWLGDDDADPQLVQKLQQAVDRVVTDYQGDDRVFEEVNSEVQAHFNAMARKAEVAERRHVEAARGKDRLEVAKHRATEAIENALEGHTPQKFVQALLNQAWADVLTLTLLRNGDDSEEWQAQEKLTERIVAATNAEPDVALDGDADAEAGAETRARVQGDPELAPQIESALVQVGYHEDEAAAIARRLSNTDASEETVSNTELSVRLKARGEFGEQAVAKKAPPPKRTSKEEKCHEYLRTLPFGTWFEFVKNQQGDVIRQRLSWFNPITDNALFVNHRGQRIGEQSLDSLARLMAREQVHVVTEGKNRLIDRAWQATIGTLRNLTGGASAAATGGAGA